MDDDRKLLGVRVDKETHKRMKLYAIEKGVTIQDYLLGLIEADMKQHEKKGEHTT